MAIQMTTNCVTIVPFEKRFQQAVEKLVLPIQQREFGVPITLEEQPDLVDIAGTFQRQSGNFWVALIRGEVVGTIGLIDIGNQEMCLKKMFVCKDFRGAAHGVGQALMEQAKQWSHSKKVRRIYLGTTPQMVAAHKFYEKNGFVAVLPEDLPAAFPVVHVDKRFYRCDLV